MVSDSVLVDRLRELLETSDLYTTTAAALRRALEEEFDIDLSDRKTFIRKQIEAFIDENDGADDNAEGKEEEVEESNGERSKKGRSDKVDDAVEKRGGALNFIKPCRLSPQLQTFVGVAELARPEVVKRIWAYIREKDLQDPKNRRKILCDKTLRAIFHVKSIDSFQMSKALSEHIWHPNKKVPAKSSQKARQCKQGREGENSSLELGIDLSNHKTFIKKQIEVFIDKRTENDGVNDNAEEEEEVEKSDGERSEKGRSDKVDDALEKRGRALNFIKSCGLSPQLQTFVGVAELSGPEVVKKIWAYIREKDLQDPMNKRKILCDETLRAIFHVKSIDMFEMTKALSEHIWYLNKKGPVKSSQKKRQRKQGREGSNEPKGKRQKARSSGLLSPLPLSDALVKFFDTGESVLSWADVTKKMWDYIKQNDLQDPSDKRRILCDQRLKELFGVDSFTGFTVSRLLATHFIKAEL